MVIKLTEFVDHVTEDDERYLGFSLENKACEIASNIA